MAGMDAIMEVARRLLLLQAADGAEDHSLWEHSERVGRYCLSISRLPELLGTKMDRQAILVAAWFHEAGRAQYLRDRGRLGRQILNDLSAEDLRDFSTQLLAERLCELLPPRQISKAGLIITEFGNRHTELVEAMVLADADSLDDIGLVGLWRQMRQGVFEPGGLAQLISRWQKRLQYGYFQARLREGFRFASVRAVAERRYEALRGFMEQLALEHRADDLRVFDERRVSAG